ncbi:hypothetical protein OAN12_03545 [Halioglobus sp.]|nr:hypothetical protein [Halioglobus sp.]
MNLVFNAGLFFLTLYMFMDVAIRGDGTSRPEVQLAAGLGLGFMLIYNLYYLFSRYRITRDWPFMKLWLAFIFLLFIYYLLAFAELPSSRAVTSHRNILVAFYCFSVILFIYHGVLRGHLTSLKVSLLLVVLLANGLFEIYYAFSGVYIRQGVEIVNTAGGYVFLMLAPLLMYRYRGHNIWMFGGTVLLTIMTGKRGPIVIYAFLVLYSIVNMRVLSRYMKLNIKTFLVILGLAIMAFLVVDSSLDNLQYRFANMVNEDKGTVGSGRNIIWGELWSFWSSGSVGQLFFGSGFYSTLSITGKVAHNDFVQFLSDFGLVGLGCYVLVVMNFFAATRKSMKVDPYLGYLLTVCFLILVGRGMISGTIRTDNVNLSVSIGYLLAMCSLLRRRYGPY